MYYELWDIGGRNLMDDFESLAEAVQAAREYTEVNPGIYPDGLALARIEDNGKTTWPARGTAIFDLTEESTERRPRRTA